MIYMLVVFHFKYILHMNLSWESYPFSLYETKNMPSYFVVGCPRGVMVKVIDCGIVVSEFVLQLCYYVYFRANTLGKGMNPLILPAMG